MAVGSVTDQEQNEVAINLMETKHKKQFPCIHADPTALDRLVGMREA